MILQFIVMSLAVWRLSHMLWVESGPFDMFERLREVFIIEDRRGTHTRWFFGDLLLCIKCLSVWVAIPFAWYLSNNFMEFLAYDLALSAAAIFLNAIFEKSE